MSWQLPPASRGQGRGLQGVGWHGGGDSLVRLPGDPPNPTRRVSFPTAPLKAMVKYGVGGGGTK